MDDRRDDSTTPPDGPRDWADLHLWQIRFLRDIVAAGIVVVLFWLGYALRDVTVPLLVALLLAYLAEPAVQWATAKRWIPFKRLGSIIVFLSLFILAILATIAFVLPPTVNQVIELVNEVESGAARTKLIRLTDEYAPDRVQADIIEFLEFLPVGRPQLDEEMAPDVNATGGTAVGTTAQPGDPASTADTSEETARTSSPGEPSEVLHKVGTTARENAGVLFGLVRQGGSIAWAVLLEMLTIGMLLFLIPFYFFFFSLWYPHVAQFVNGMLPERNRDRTRELLSKMDAAVAGFVRGRILIAIIMSVMFVVGYIFVGVPYAILLGIAVGFLSIVPYLGLVGIPAAILLMFVGQLELAEGDRMAWWAVLLWPTVVYAVVSAIDGWILTPWIQGKSTNLDPVTIFVAILAGGSVLGVYGMLISIPVAACIKIMLSEIVVPKLRELGSRPRAGET